MAVEESHLRGSVRRADLGRRRDDGARQKLGELEPGDDGDHGVTTIGAFGFSPNISGA
jgi:hypothetical protein